MCRFLQKLSRVSCPTAVYGEKEIAMLQKILVPLDGSELAEKALPYAEELADKFDGELILVWALHPQPLVAMSDYGATAYGEVTEQEEAEANKYLRSWQDKFRRRNIRARIAVLRGPSVADAIVDCACQEKADVIVKTTHGRSGLSRWIYGSVATKVLQQAPCPVFLVRVSGGDN
jgi:nucleotide-binding universal stress UspA family protein